MAEPLPPSAIRGAPREFPGLIEWFGRLSDGLVLLEPYELPALRQAIDGVAESTRRHARATRELEVESPGLSPSGRRLARLVQVDHAWFELSVEQLYWFLEIVEREDHGGHRQALGQYGRLVVEAFRRHLADEAHLRRERAETGRRAGELPRAPTRPKTSEKP